MKNVFVSVCHLKIVISCVIDQEISDREYSDVAKINFYYCEIYIL